MTTPQHLYASEYVRAALAQDKLDAPDLGRANGTGEILASIYEAHKLGGKESARTAWEKVKPYRPEYAWLERGLTKLIHASELKYLSKPEVELATYPWYKRGFNLLIGPSGSAKSFTALDFAGYLAQPTADEPDRAVIYIAGEGLLSYRSRWEAWKDYTGLDDGNLYFHEEAVQLIDDAARAAFADLIRPRRPRMIIVDTVARCALGIEENSAKEMGMFIGACDSLRTEFDCGILAVHHTGKDGKIRGSSSLYAAADAVVFQTKTDNRVTLINSPDGGGKNKYDKEQETRYLQLVPRIVGEYEGAVLMPANNVIQSADDRLPSNQRQILEALDGFPKGLSAKAILDATGISHAHIYRLFPKLLTLKFIEQEDERYLITEDGRNALFR